MMNQRKAWLAAGVLAVVAAACFSDPTSDLRSGPTAMRTNLHSVSVRNGDSTAIQATVVDNQGNPLPIEGATWTSADPSVAVVHLDTVRPAPGDIFTRAFVQGINNQGGVTTVTVSARGVTADVRVTVLPRTFPGTAAVSGTAQADTIVINRPSPQPALVVPYTAGDTLVLTGTASLSFTNGSTVSFGPFPGYIISSNATVIKAMARQPYAGPVTVTNLVYAGNAATGSVAISSILTDSVMISRARLPGAAVAVAASAFGPGTQMTITAPTGMTFNTVAPLTTVTLGTAAGTILSRTATTITLISTANYSGSVLLNNVTIGSAAVDSVRTGTGPIAITASNFPGTVSSPTGNLLDTITVAGGASATFTTTGASASQVTVNGVVAFLLTRTASTITVIAKLPGSAKVAISNVIVAGTTIPSLSTQNPFTVNATTGEVNEPGNNGRLGATALAFTGAADTITVYGSVDCEDDGSACPGNGDVSDYYTVTLGTNNKLRAIVDWFGNGTGGTPYGSDKNNPDLDVLICLTGASCTYNSSDLTGFSGAGLSQPETASTSAIQAPGTYHVRVFGYVTPAPITYKLRVLRF